MSDPLQLAFLIVVVAAFAIFGITLFAVAIYVNTAEPKVAAPPPRKVIPANQSETRPVR